MTPEQLGALESVAERPLTAEEIAQIEPLLDPENRNDVAIAALLSIGLPQTESREVEAWRAKKILIKRLKWRGIVEASSNVQNAAREAAYAAVAIADSTSMMVDFLDPVSNQLLGQLKAANLVDADTEAALKALSAVERRLAVDTVSRVLNVAEGRMVM